MGESTSNIPGMMENQAQEISLSAKDITINNNNIGKLMAFLQEKIEGKYFLNDKIDGTQMLRTCRDEVLRKNDISIKSLQSDSKTKLQILIGEYLFETLQPEKQQEIITAILNKENKNVLIKLDVTGIDDEKMSFPWEYMRCSEIQAGKYQLENPSAIFLCGADTMFYRTTGNKEKSSKANPVINVLVVDATTEQKIYKFFSPPDNDQQGQEKIRKFKDKIKNINFDVLGQDEGEKRAVLANLIDTVELNKPAIIHFVVDSFSVQKDISYLKFLIPNNKNDGNTGQEFSEHSISEMKNKWLIDGVAVLLIQEWPSEEQNQFEALEKIAFQLSKNKIPSTVIIPSQPTLPAEKDHFELFYAGLSGGDTVGTAVKRLRVSFLKKDCYSLPIHYLSTKDFILLENSKSIVTPPPNVNPRSPGPIFDPMESMNELISKHIKLFGELETLSGEPRVNLLMAIEKQRTKMKEKYHTNPDLFNEFYKDIDGFAAYIKTIDHEFLI